MGEKEEIREAAQPIECDSCDCKMPDPSLAGYWKMAGNRKYFYCEDVCDSVIGLEQEIININDDDKGVPAEERKPIVLYIHSYGGDADFMYSLVDTMLASVTPIYTVNMGECASAAALIYLAGGKRFMMRHAKFMIHQGSSSISGDAGKVMDATKEYKDLLKGMEEFILSRTSIPKSTISKKRLHDWTLTLDECVKYNVCTAVINNLDEIA